MSFGLSAGTLGLITAGVGLAGSVMGAGAAGDAADVQSQAGREAAALQQKQFEQTRADLSPFRETGVLANNKLAQLLGLSGGGGASGGGLSREQLRQQLLGQYTTSAPGGIDRSRLTNIQGDPNSIMGAFDGNGENLANYGGNTGKERWWDDQTQSAWAVPVGWGGSQSTVDEAGLNAAIEAAFAGQGGATNPAGDDFGMLLKKYTGQELLSDPGYLFRRSEGQKGVERSAAGRGGLFSGQAGKELERFNQGLASTEFQAGFNRDQAYKGQTYGMLSGTSGAGQNAANMTGTAGANAAAGAGNYLTQAANADASGIVGGANAINSGIGNFQNYNMLNSIFNKTVQGGGTPYNPVAGYGMGNLGSGS